MGYGCYQEVKKHRQKMYITANGRLDTDPATWMMVYMAGWICWIFCSATIMSFQIQQGLKTLVKVTFFFCFWDRAI